MFTDARTLADGFVTEADICIVGSGAAGLTLATQLADRAVSVCLLESGGLEPDLAVQALNTGVGRGTFVDARYVLGTRHRGFGGSTSHWAGCCGLLQPIDFEPRAWVRDSGWPFGREHLDPFYRRATTFFGFDTFDADHVDEGDEHRSRWLDDDTFHGRTYRWNALRFGPALREDIERAPNVHVLLHATAVEIRIDESARAVETVRIATLSGIRGTVKAKAVVLATGGIENARLLLASDRQRPRGLGNEHDLVGRYFMEHPHTGGPGRRAGAGPLFLWPGVTVDAYEMHDGRARFLHLAADEQRRRRLLNVGLRVWPMSEPAPADPFATLDEPAARSSFDIDRIATPQGGASEPVAVVARFEVEPAPNPLNRVTLTDRRDRLGMRQVRVEFRATEAELRTIYECSALLVRAVGASGRGRLRNPVPAPQLRRRLGPGGHHMGTTRMHDDPTRGVVDADCRVHGVDGLFIAGSSVFPTAGIAPPTFTIVAMAMRLADHLKRRFAVT